MRECDLQRMVTEGTIMSFEVLEQNDDGDILEMKIRPMPPINKAWLSSRLAVAAKVAAAKLGLNSRRERVFWK